jgi:hypothetical protein
MSTTPPERALLVRKGVYDSVFLYDADRGYWTRVPGSRFTRSEIVSSYPDAREVLLVPLAAGKVLELVQRWPFVGVALAVGDLLTTAARLHPAYWRSADPGITALLEAIAQVTDAVQHPASEDGGAGDGA